MRKVSEGKASVPKYEYGTPPPPLKLDRTDFRHNFRKICNDLNSEIYLAFSSHNRKE